MGYGPNLWGAWLWQADVANLCLVVLAAFFPEIASRPFVLLMFLPSPAYFHNRLIFYGEMGTAACGRGTHLSQDRADKAAGSWVLNTAPLHLPGLRVTGNTVDSYAAQRGYLGLE